jgi:hypothetical protein
MYFETVDWATSNAVVGGDRAVAKALGQFARHAFGHAAGIDEHQRGAVFLNESRQTIINLLPDLAGHHCLKRGAWNLNLKVAIALLANVDDRQLSRAVGT